MPAARTRPGSVALHGVTAWIMPHSGQALSKVTMAKAAPQWAQYQLAPATRCPQRAHFMRYSVMPRGSR